MGLSKYEIVRENEWIYVDSDFGTQYFGGLVVTVEAKLDLVVKDEKANAAICDTYTITVAPGEAIALALHKTMPTIGEFATSAEVKIAVREDREFGEKEIHGTKADSGFSEVVTASDGTTYRLLYNDSDVAKDYYIGISATSVKYSFDAGDLDNIEEAIEIAEDLADLLDDDRDLWPERFDEEVADAGGDHTVDIFTTMCDKYDDLGQLAKDAIDMFKKNPLVTYQLDVKQLDSDSVPIILDCDITSLGNLVYVETEAYDDLFVKEFRITIFDGDGTVVSPQISKEALVFVNGLAAGDYTVSVEANNYFNNWSEAYTDIISVSPDDEKYVGGYGLLDKKNVLTEIETFTVDGSSDSKVFSWFDIDSSIENGKITIQVHNSKGKKVATATYENGELTSGTNFALTPDTYTVKATTNKETGDLTVILKERTDLYSDDNIFSKAQVLTLDPAGQASASDYVGLGDALDNFRIDLTEPGNLFVDVQGNTANVKLQIYDSNNKKLKDVTVSSSKDTLDISKLFLNTNTVYITVTSADNGKGKYNTEFSLTATFEAFEKPDFDTVYAVQGNLEFADPAGAKGWVGYGDASDFFKVIMPTSGKYTFSFDEAFAENVKVTLYMRDNSKKGYKSVKSASGKNPVIKDVLLDTANEYFVEVNMPTAAKGGSVDYKLLMSGETFAAANKYADSWEDFMANTDNAPVISLSEGRSNALISNEWVGYGDVWDYRKLDIAMSGRFSFIFDCNAAAQFTIYQKVTKNGKVTLKSVKNVSSNGKKLAEIKNLLMTDDAEYYLAVKAKQPNKSTGTIGNYSVELGADSVFFTKGDDGTNDNCLTTTGECNIQNPIVGWVGYGDATDYARFELITGAELNFTVNSTDALTFTINEVITQKNGKQTVKALQSTKVAAGKTITTKNLVLGNGVYYIGVTSTNAAKGGSADYKITLNQYNSFADAADNTDDTFALVKNNSTTMWNGADIMGWVGYEDKADVFKFELDHAGKLTLALDKDTADAYDKKALKISCLDEKGRSIALLWDTATDTFTSRNEYNSGAICYASVTLGNNKIYDMTYGMTAGILA
ncbi:MAG: hypothetical protein IKB16_04360 [Lentisphaeria bacterium]|nr:hypothetical protein [Lentisphaeria bacterium]